MDHTGTARFRVASSARRHKIGKAHVFAAITNAGTPTLIDDQLHWVGEDDRGVELHVVGFVAVEDPDLVIVIHVQPTSQRRPT